MMYNFRNWWRGESRQPKTKMPAMDKRNLEFSYLRHLACLAGLLFAAGALLGQDAALQPVSVSKKHALLIGNSEFAASVSLGESTGNARALEGVLVDLGFAVTREENLTLREMETQLRMFTAKLDEGDLALFYYSGLGVQVEEENYLLPVDYAEGTQPAEMKYEALPVQQVQDLLKGTGAKVRVLVLDACRSMPFGTGQIAERGLASMEPDGDLIVFSTGAGDVVSNNQDGELGLYMTHLLLELRREEIELKNALDRTRVAVYDAARRRGENQRPAQFGDLDGKVYLRGGPDSQVSNAIGSIDPNVSPALKAPADRWMAIRNQTDPAVFTEFIEVYGTREDAVYFVREAKLRTENLEEQKRQEVIVEAARAAWETTVSKTDDPDELRRFVAAFEKVPGADQLVHQAWERYDQIVVRIPGQAWSNDLGMEFVWIPAGRFLMGSTSKRAEKDEKRVTDVTISQGFYMGKYEVTQRQWQEVVRSFPWDFERCGLDCPVQNVSWNDVQHFVANLNEREAGRAYEYRLPTEAEWEYAARAETTGDRYAADIHSIAWFYRSRPKSLQPIGQKDPNAWGLHDMLGNVWEWVEDWYGEYPGGVVTDPTGPRFGQRRVTRGCSTNTIAKNCRTPFRSLRLPDYRNKYYGFRVVRTK